MFGDPLVTVGNHGHRHAHMTWLTPAEQRADLALAAARFHTELGKAPDLFAYPYGEISQTLRRNVAEAGFTAAFGQHSGAAGAPADRSEERRGGQEVDSTFRSRWSPYHEKKKQ